MALAAVMAVTMIPTLSYATDSSPDTVSGKANYGRIESNVDVRNAGNRNIFRQYSLNHTYAEKYDPRELSWYKNSITVKNQGNSGICWACAATLAGEISYAKETNGAQTLSPAHLAYFFNNRVNDPLGGTAGDKNMNGCDKSDWQNNGGNCVYTSQLLANWGGCAANDKYPVEKIQCSYPASAAYDNTSIVENSYLVWLNSEDRIKAALSKYGALVAGIYWDENNAYYNDSTYGFYNKKGAKNSSPYKNDASAANHEVTIIGWDDNYSRYNFNETPSRDGAWIVQNSWGENMLDEGCFYLSYESCELNQSSSLGMALDMQPADKYDYNFQYDGSCGTVYMDAESEWEMANIFTVPSGFGDLTLDAFGVTNWSTSSMAVDYRIYTDVTSGDPSGGTLSASGTVKTSGMGFNTFELADPVTIKEGTKYSIMLIPKSGLSIGVEAKGDNEGDGNFIGSVSAGQSYIYEDGEWTDLGKMGSDSFSLRIKGFANKKETSGNECSHTNTAVVTKKAGFGNAGTVEETCSKCGEIKRSTIPAITAVTTESAEFAYSGEEIHPSVKLQDSNGDYVDPSNYSVKYCTYSGEQTASVYAGRYKIKVTLKGEKYSGSTYMNYVISPEKMSLSLSAGKKKFTARWKQASGEDINNISGYQLYYKAGVTGKTINVPENSCSRTVKKLKSRKKYKVKIRSYKVSEGMTIYGEWSNYKNVRVK